MTAPEQAPPAARAISAKIVIAGEFGVGKTTLVAAVSDIVPLRTEALMTDLSSEVDDTSKVPDKQTTTVAMDFGRITLSDDLVLYLFGTPGQHRFWFMWDDLSLGAIGAILLVDTRRVDESFAAVDYFEELGLPFLVAVNEFDGAPKFPEEAIRDALSLSADVPVMMIDARNRESAKTALIALTGHALARVKAKS
ncbi:ATP/GTP-binding protein [Nocardia sp. NBC_00565]|uniref:GTP-binding protein n=1 Tax=Nocardia sp. NBC_00565 TaxID=2975993 RepID=UPI002E7FEA3D|nr:ATP/GTP-binding protein [Nocardia sp. NBC_00565]WUC02659.1 ATP/GTP-binding protein [Nocardia sp. NBC_00565]